MDTPGAGTDVAACRCECDREPAADPLARWPRSAWSSRRRRTPRRSPMHARDAPSNRSFLPERLQWSALQWPSHPEWRDSGRRLRGGLVTERQQRGSWRVHCGGSRRAAASGAPGGLWKADARYIRSTWHGDARWQGCRHDGSVSCRLRQAGWSRLRRSGTLRGRCPWLSVRQGGQEPAGTDI